LNILQIHFACISSSSVPMILGFGLLRSQWIHAYSFHRSWVVWLIVLKFFLSLPFPLQVLRFCLLLVLVSWSSLPFCFVFLFLFSEVFHMMGHFLFNIVNFLT
jgi:hypothetical protein